jgi:hypothetical protein
MKNYLQDVQPKMTVDNYTNASQALNPKMDANTDLTSQPRMADPNLASTPRPMNPNIKNSGAPVPFSPKSASTINGVFGTGMENSFDRTMSSMDPAQEPQM